MTPDTERRVGLGWKIDGDKIEILGVDADRTPDEELAHYPWTVFHGLPDWAAKLLADRVKAYRLRVGA